MTAWDPPGHTPGIGSADAPGDPCRACGIQAANEPWKVLEYCRSLGEIFDIVVEDMFRQARGLKG